MALQSSLLKLIIHIVKLHSPTKRQHQPREAPRDQFDPKIFSSLRRPTSPRESGHPTSRSTLFPDLHYYCLCGRRLSAFGPTDRQTGKNVLPDRKCPMARCFCRLLTPNINATVIIHADLSESWLGFPRTISPPRWRDVTGP